MKAGQKDILMTRVNIYKQAKYLLLFLKNLLRKCIEEIREHKLSYRDAGKKKLRKEHNFINKHNKNTNNHNR